jgi:hypothetical protein
MSELAELVTELAKERQALEELQFDGKSVEEQGFERGGNDG